MNRLATLLPAVLSLSSAALAHPGHGAPQGHHHDWLMEALLVGIPAAVAVAWVLSRAIRRMRRGR